MSGARITANKEYDPIQAKADKTLFIAKYYHHLDGIEAVLDSIVNNNIKNVVTMKTDLIKTFLNPTAAYHYLDIESHLAYLNERSDAAHDPSIRYVATHNAVRMGKYKLFFSAEHKDSNAPILTIENIETKAVHTFQVHYVPTADLSKDPKMVAKLADLFLQDKPLLIMQSNNCDRFYNALIAAFALFKTGAFRTRSVSEKAASRYFAGYGIPEDKWFLEKSVDDLTNNQLFYNLANALETHRQSQLKKSTSSEALSPLSPAPLRPVSVSSIKSSASAAEVKTPLSVTSPMSVASIQSKLSQNSSSQSQLDGDGVARLLPGHKEHIVIEGHGDVIMARDDRKAHEYETKKQAEQREEERKKAKTETDPAKLAIRSFNSFVSRASIIAVDIKKKAKRTAKEIPGAASELADSVSSFIKALPRWDSN